VRFPVRVMPSPKKLAERLAPAEAHRSLSLVDGLRPTSMATDGLPTASRRRRFAACCGPRMDGSPRRSNSRASSQSVPRDAVSSRRSSPSDARNVWLQVYDVLGAEEANEAAIRLGFGVFHVGIEVFGVEWSYGFVESDALSQLATGVYPVKPQTCPVGTHRDSVFLGTLTGQSARNVWWLLSGLASSWLGEEYHSFRRNCFHFCTEVCRLLGVNAPPLWAGRLAHVASILLTPLLDVVDGPPRPPQVLLPDSRMELAEEINWLGEEASKITVSEVQCGLGEGVEDRDVNKLKYPEFRGVRAHPRLLLVTSVALDFEESCGWALGVMLRRERSSVLPTRSHRIRDASPCKAAICC